MFLTHSPRTLAQESALTAENVVVNWRKAVRGNASHGAAILTRTSTEDGIPGHLVEWFGKNGEYRIVAKREFDESETVVTPQAAVRKDWNGFLRMMDGEELRRLRTAIIAEQVLVFGPTDAMTKATVEESDSGKLIALSFDVEGGCEITWYIDPKTWLPGKMTRPGNDTEITEQYRDWQPSDSTVMPHRTTVLETGKPDYELQVVGLEAKATLPANVFGTPTAAASDVLEKGAIPPIAFNFDSSHIIFKVSVNGHEPIWFIFDTGADQNIVSASRAEEYGVKSYAKTTTTGGGNSTEYEYAANASLSVPGVELRNQHVAVLDNRGLEEALGMPIGGILGYDFISRFVVEIDYEKHLITLHDPKGWKYSGTGYIVPIVFDEGIPFTHGTISVPTKQQIPGYFVLDFGALETMTLTSPFVKENDLTRLAQTNGAVNRPAGLENQFFAQNNVRGRIEQLELGKLSIRSIPINMSVNTKGAYASQTFSGTIGQGIYRRYHVFIDYARNRVILEPTAEAEKPFPERQTYGLSLLASGADLHTYEVAAVRPGSPAEQDGFKKGDVIAAVDEKSSAQFTLGELRVQLLNEGHKLQLAVVRGSERLNFSVQVRLVSLERQ